MADIEEMLTLNPDFIIIGTGKFNTIKISDRVKDELDSRGIVLTCANTDEACRKTQ